MARGRGGAQGSAGRKLQGSHQCMQHKALCPVRNVDSLKQCMCSVCMACCPWTCTTCFPLFPHTSPTPSLSPQLLEGFMARKPPSAEDLRGLLPTVWWPGCKEEGGSEGRMRAGLAAFADAKLKVEEQQYGLLAVLVGRPTNDERDDALVAFVR